MDLKAGDLPRAVTIFVMGAVGVGLSRVGVSIEEGTALARGIYTTLGGDPHAYDKNPVRYDPHTAFAKA